MAYFKYQYKDIFYEEYGQGEPIIFLHGNTASSKMYEFLMPLYTENFRCILIDFLGNGQSDRVESFSPDMWYDEALQTIALTEHLQCGKVSLIGTSGGALLMKIFPLIFYLKGKRRKKMHSQGNFTNCVKVQTGKR